MQSSLRLLAARRAATRAVMRAVELSNVTADPRAEVQHVRQVLRRHGEPESVVLTGEDVHLLRSAVDKLRPVLVAETVSQAAGALNRILSTSTGRMRLTTHSGESEWHPHLDTHDDAPWDVWFTSSSAFALALLVWEYQRPPCRACASLTCSNVLLTVGDGPERRFCSRRCATRERVAAHRARGGV